MRYALSIIEPNYHSSFFCSSAMLLSAVCCGIQSTDMKRPNDPPSDFKATHGIHHILRISRLMICDRWTNSDALCFVPLSVLCDPICKAMRDARPEGKSLDLLRLLALEPLQRNIVLFICIMQFDKLRC